MVKMVLNTSYYEQGVPKNVLLEQNHNQNWVQWGTCANMNTLQEELPVANTK